MNKFNIILLLAMLSVNSLLSQTFLSQHQEFEEQIYKKEKKIIIQDGKIKMEFPYSNKSFTGTIKSKEEEEVDDFIRTVYYFEGGGLISFNKDNIFANLHATPLDESFAYYLDEYVEPTPEELARQEIQAIETEKLAIEDWSQYLYKRNVETYGELNAQCIRDKKPRKGMDALLLGVVLGTEYSIEVNEGVAVFVYDNCYVYAENNIVTAIQEIN